MLVDSLNPLTEPPLLELECIYHRFGETEVLHDVSFALSPGEVIALMGANGAGKSTLMSILSGALVPTEGRLRWNGSDIELRAPGDSHALGIAMVQQELQLVPELSVAENMLLGREPRGRFGTIDRGSMHRHARQSLDRLGARFDADCKIRDLRVAEQQMVEIGKALSRDAKLLILDEPTSALSEQEVKDLLSIVKHLSAAGTAILYISHRMDEIFEIASRVIVLRDGELISDRPIDQVRRGELIFDMAGEAIAEHSRARQATTAEIVRLSVRGLTCRLGNGHRELSDISFDIAPGEILGLGGLVGSGRSELLELIGGSSGKPWSGAMLLDGKAYRPSQPADSIAAGVAFVTEDRKTSGLILQQSISDNIALASLSRLSPLGIIDAGARRALASESIKHFAIKARSSSDEVGSLSGGNQQKVVLAKWLATSPRLLLLDEPTRGIDVAAKAAFYHLIEEMVKSDLSILLVSSDWAELIALSDRILVLQQGRAAALFDRAECTQARLLEHATPGGPILPLSGARQAA